MTREFIRTSYFDKYWHAMKLNDDDLRELEIFLMENSGSGDVIQGTGGAVKLRWALAAMRKASAGVFG